MFYNEEAQHCFFSDWFLGGRGQSNALPWFESFLEGHTQWVVMENSTSTTRPLICRVPQGSVFSSPIQQLHELVRGHGLECQQYTDDTQLSFITYSHTTTIRMAQDGLEEINSWMKNSCLKLKSRKTEVMMLNRGKYFEVQSPLVESPHNWSIECVV